MKRVFSSHDEVCRVWASRSQDTRRAGNIDFRGDTIYSYGHYAIAHFINDKLCLVQSDTCSSSTSAHISCAAYHARKTHKILHVVDLTPDHAVNCKDFENRLCEMTDKFWDATRLAKWYLRRYFHTLKEYRLYAECFGLKLPPFVGYGLNQNKAENKIAEIERRRWNGVFIPKWLFYKKTLSPKDLVRIKNAQVRAEFVKKVGIDRIIYELGEVVDTVGNYQLVMLDLQDGRKRPFLKMQNPSCPELWHVEGVHPNCRTVADALQYRRYGRESIFANTKPLDEWKPEILT